MPGPGDIGGSPYDEVPLVEDDFQEPDLDEERRFGALCSAYLHGEPYRRVRVHMEAIIQEAFKATPIRDTEGLTYLRLMQKVLDDTDALLRDAVATGNMSAEQLLEKARERPDNVGEAA